MIFVIANALLYIGLLIWYWRKNRVVDEGFLLIAFWGMVASLGIAIFFDNPRAWNLKLWPFVYLVFVFLVFTRYILQREKRSFPIKSFVKTKNVFLDAINIIYILCAIYELTHIDISVLSYTYLSQEAQGLYEKAHEQMELVKGPLFYCQRYTSALFVLAAMSFFNYLSQGRNLFGWSLFSFTFISTLAGNASTATRGVMFSQVLIMVCIYLLYRPYLTNNVKKSIKRGGLIAGTALAAFFVAITVSRFSTSFGVYESPLQSVYYYFGHSMLYFNYGICDVDFSTYGGARTFHYFSRLLLGTDFTKMSIPETHFGSSFTTSFGLVVLDFGYVGTVVFGLLVSYIMYKMWSGKNRYSFAGMYIYMFYLNRMFMAVFTNSPGSDYNYAWAILTYILLKLVVTPTKHNVTIKR